MTLFDAEVPERPTSGDEPGPEPLIRGQGTLTIEDFAEAYRMVFATTWKSLGLVALVFGLIGLPNVCRLPTVTQSAAMLVVYMGMGTIVCALGSLLDGIRADRHFKNLQLTFREVLITDDGIEHRLQAGSETYAWAQFLGYGRSERLIVLLMKSPLRAFQVFPRELFGSSTDWERFAEIVARKIPRR